MKTIIEKQSAVLTKIYKSHREIDKERFCFKCEESGITYYSFQYGLLIPNSDIIGVEVPEYSQPHFLRLFHYFGDGPAEYRIPNIPDKKDLKEMIKAAGGIRYNPAFQITCYDADGFGTCGPLKDDRYIAAKHLLWIYEFLDESEYQNIDIYVAPAQRSAAFYFKGEYGSGYIMPILNCRSYVVINKED